MRIFSFKLCTVTTYREKWQKDLWLTDGRTQHALEKTSTFQVSCKICQSHHKHRKQLQGATLLSLSSLPLPFSLSNVRHSNLVLDCLLSAFMTFSFSPAIQIDILSFPNYYRFFFPVKWGLRKIMNQISISIIWDIFIFLFKKSTLYMGLRT